MLAASDVDLEEEGEASDVEEPVAGVAEVRSVDGVVAQVVVKGDVGEVSVEVQVDSVDVELEPELLASTGKGGGTLAGDEVVLFSVHGEVEGVANIGVPFPVVVDVAVSIIVNALDSVHAASVHLNIRSFNDGVNEHVHLLVVGGLLSGEAEVAEDSVVEHVSESVTSEGGCGGHSGGGSEFHFL